MSNGTTKAGGWGKPKYGAPSGQKTGKPKEGDNFIRILPPMHSLAEAGQWAFYETTHWGFFGVNPSDPSQPFHRPIRCVEVKDRRSQMVSVACAACDRYNAEEEAAKAKEAELKASGMSEDQIATEMAATNDWLKANRPERRWYVNVMYKDGTFGNYKLNHKFHMAKLRELTEGPKSLQEVEGIDPLDLDQGVWFNVCRKGKGINVVDTIEVEKEAVDVPGQTRKVWQTKLAPLTAEQADQALKECVDLPTLGGTTVTPEQMDQLVNCSGEPEEIDRILGIQAQPAKNTGKSAIKPPTERKAPAEAAAPPAAKTPPVETKVPAPETKAAPAQAAATNPAIQKRLAEIKAKQEAERAARQAADAAAAEAAKKEASPAEVDPMSLSDEEFAKYFGNASGE